MGVLGRGLASLIPKRSATDLENIDEMEFDEELSVNVSTPSKEAKEEAVVNTSASEAPAKSLDPDFTRIEQEDAPAMPSKPLTSPLPFDPFAEDASEKVVAQEVDEDEALLETHEDEPVEEAHDELEEEMHKMLEEMAEEDSEPVVSEVKEEDVVPTAPAVHGRAIHARTTALPEEIIEAVEKEVKIAPAVAPAPAMKEVAEAPVAKEKAEVKVETPQPAVAREMEEEAIMPSFGDGSGSSEMWDKHEQNVQHVPISQIRINPLQPRRTFALEELADLASSIAQHGILQPLVVRRLANDDGYELIAGERRLRSATKLGWDKVPCVVRMDVKSDQSRLVFALIENIQRENLSPVEEALAYKQLNEEYGLTHEEIGERMGKSRVAVTNIVRILQLPEEIQRGLTEGKITTGHAKAILMIPDEDKQIKFYRHLVDEGLTVRKAEIRARRIQRSMNLNDPMRRLSRGRHPLALKYSPALENRFGYDANVKYLADKNSFEVVFKANNETEINELVDRLLGKKELPLDVDKDVIGDDGVDPESDV